MSISDVLRSVTGKRETCLLQHRVMLGCGNTVGRKNWDKTKQNVAALNCFQLCTTGSNLMHSIHNVDEYFYTIRNKPNLKKQLSRHNRAYRLKKKKLTRGSFVQRKTKWKTNVSVPIYVSCPKSLCITALFSSQPFFFQRKWKSSF